MSLNEFKKQQVNNDKMYDPKLMDDVLRRMAPICIKCFDELLMQKIINDKAYDQKVMADAINKVAWKCLKENIVVNGGIRYL